MKITYTSNKTTSTIEIENDDIDIQELGQILYKCSKRKETLEKELNVIIPDNVDLWDIPDESIEYLR